MYGLTKTLSFAVLVTIWLECFVVQPYMLISVLTVMRHMSNVALCEARHPIKAETQYGDPVERAIFPQIVENPMHFSGLEDVAHEWFIKERDFFQIKENDTWIINLYVTGLTPCLVAVINTALYYQTGGFKVILTLYHYNRETGGYEAQAIHPNN
tara:strand:+ start:130 stop:594 length:465 start_codon:yes stop_codon:yes gene_type:complete